MEHFKPYSQIIQSIETPQTTQFIETPPTT